MILEPAAVAEIARRTREFVVSEILPLEDEHDGDLTAAGGDDLRVELQTAAKKHGVFGPHVPTEYGGMGLHLGSFSRIFEAAGYSLFGPLALNGAAPDEGNIHLLNVVAKGEQRERFLAPLATGEVRSAFAMTEPGGAGADPSALSTTATRVGDSWRLDGSKTLITGADGAAFLIVMARTSGTVGDRGGATMFLVPLPSAGVTVGRHVPTMDRSMLGGHCEVTLDDVRVGPEAVLGEVDEGFRYAQVRLGPARMTHVMRWLGAAVRAQEVAVDYASSRSTFGGRLAELGMAQQMIADNEIDLAATRALLDVACAELDAGGDGAQATSIAKTFGAEAIGRVADRAMQLCGGLGMSSDLAVARIAREVRPFRVYDGPSEVHRMAIARRAVSAARKRKNT